MPPSSPTAPVNRSALLAALAGLLLAVFPPELPAQRAAPELHPVYAELGALAPGARSPVESPLGRFILFEAASEREPRQLGVFDRQTGRWSALGGGDVEHAWSPRGDRLAFSKNDDAGQWMYVWTVPVDPRTPRLAGPPRRVSVRTGRSPTFSPDGRRIAFSVIPPTDTAAPRIVSIPAGGGPERILVRQTGWAQMLRWSPDGRWIYYRHAAVANAGGPWTLSRVPAEGGEAEVLRPIRHFFDVSRDGRFLAYTPPERPADPERMVVGISTAEGVELGRFTLPRHTTIHSWSSSGWKLLAVRATEVKAIQMLPLRGGPVRALTTGGNGERDPAWSPDGRRVAFVSLFDDRYQLSVADVRGGARREVPTRAQPAGAPLWSPDGRRIAYIAGGGAARTLHLVDLETGAEATLARAERIDAVGWRRDGRALLYARADGERQALHEVTVGGLDTSLRALEGDLASPGITLVGDSLLVVTSAAGVFTAPVRRGGHRRIHAASEGELPPVTWRRGIEVSRDGRWAALPVPDPGGDPLRVAIRILALDGGQGRVVPLVTLATVGPRPRWHPDGRHLVALGARSPDQPSDAFLVPLNGDPPRPLTGGRAGEIASLPELSPDGAALLFAAVTAPPRSSLWEIDLTRALVPFTAGGAGGARR